MTAAEIGHLGVRTFIKALDNAQDFVGLAVMDQVDRALAAEQRMFGIEPEPRLIRGIEFGKTVDHVTKIGNQQLRFRMWKRFPRRPTRNCRGRHGGNVRDVHPFEAAAFSEVVDDFCDRTRHANDPELRLLIPARRIGPIPQYNLSFRFLFCKI